MSPLALTGLGALGGAAGSALRVGLNTVLPPQDCLLESCSPTPLKGFPVATLAVNLVGSFVLGIAAHAAARREWEPWVLAFIGGGLCGGLTTMSGFVVDLVRLGYAGRWGTAVAYYVSTQACILVGILGWLLGSLTPKLADAG